MILVLFGISWVFSVFVEIVRSPHHELTSGPPGEALGHQPCSSSAPTVANSANANLRHNYDKFSSILTSTKSGFASWARQGHRMAVRLQNKGFKYSMGLSSP